MPATVDASLTWAEHYVRYGFCVLPRLIDDAFIDEALDQIARSFNVARDPATWSSDQPVCGHHPNASLPAELALVLDRVYEQPGFRAMIDTMFASPDAWDAQPAYQLFVSGYDPKAQASIGGGAHLDFVNCYIPRLGSGFMFQASLVDSEPFSGNITIWPGTHTPIQRRLIENPLAQWPDDMKDIEKPEPFEFVANRGDVLLFHHLVYHAGNASHARNRSPRCVIHGQANQATWLDAVAPGAAGNGAWHESLATNGAFDTGVDELAVRTNVKGGMEGDLLERLKAGRRTPSS